MATPPKSEPKVPSGVKQSGAGETDCFADLLSFHAEIRAALQQLATLVKTVGRADFDSAAATALVRFFEGPLLWHDEDEEVSILRRLRAVELPPSGVAAVDAVHDGHERLEAILDGLSAELRNLTDESSAGVDLDWLDQNTRSLKGLFEGHLALEEKNLFPLVAKVLPPEDLAEIRREIRARHGKSSSQSVRAKRAVPL